MQIAALVLLGGCLERVAYAPTVSGLIVHAVLETDSRTQTVLVEESTGIVSAQKSISGATVTISTPEGRIMAADEVKDTILFSTGAIDPTPRIVYRISLDRYGVTLVPGATYRLDVSYKEFRVSGTTVLPGAASPPSTSTQPFTSATDTLRLAWAHAPFAHAYEISVSSAGRITEYFAQPDTSVVLPGMSGPLAINRSNTVTVTAVDANYYDYFRRASDFFSGGGIISRLSGGVGVFGSMARVTTRVLSVK